MRSQRTSAHRSAAFLTARENVLPILIERLSTKAFGVSKIDQQLPLVAVGAESPDKASTGAPFATSWTQRATVYGLPLLVEQVQLRIGEPTGIAEARRRILLLHPCFSGKRKSAFVMLTRITMIKGLLYRPDTCEFCHPLASQKLVELNPPLSGLIR
jgi:hypothetical protein